jgi:hypothetical protein
MPAQFTIPLIVVVPGQIIAASLWNNEFENLYINLIPSGIDTYSNTDSQMQTSTDPYPSESTSRPTSLAGEIERLRFILNLIIGQTYWYQHPAISLQTLSTETPVIPVGTVMPFYQAAAPTGWTQVVTANDMAMRVVSGSSGGTTTSGTNGLSAGFALAHSHTVNSHTHDLGAHTHTMANHTHVGAAHTHTVPHTGWGQTTNNTSGVLVVEIGSPGQAASQDNTSGSTTPGAGGVPVPNTSDGPTPNLSGATAPGTSTALSTFTFSYADFLIASKN